MRKIRNRRIRPLHRIVSTVHTGGGEKNEEKDTVPMNCIPHFRSGDTFTCKKEREDMLEENEEEEDETLI